MFKQMGAEMGAEMDAEFGVEEQQSSDKNKSTPAPAAATAAAAATSATPAASSSSTGASQPTGEPSGAAFQDTIRRTMERMRSSGDQATAAAAAGGEDDFLAEMLKQLTAGDFAGGSEEDFSKMLMGMMEQLTNKEILYEPMKELHDKFPAWLDKNKDSTPADDLKRYMEQKTIVAEIVAKFNESTYSDSNAADREYIVDRMQKVTFCLLTFSRVIRRLTRRRCKRQGRHLQIWSGTWHPLKRRSMRPKTSARRNKLFTSSLGALIYTRTFIYIPIVCSLNTSTFHRIPIQRRSRALSESPDVPNSISPVDMCLDRST